MGSFLAVAFIAGIGAVAVVLGFRPTVADGRVIAADMLAQVADKGISAIDCDRDVPIGVAGAVFTCDVAGTDGSTAKVEYTMNREGSYAARVLDSTPGRQPADGGTFTPRPVAPGGDPWAP